MSSNCDNGKLPTGNMTMKQQVDMSGPVDAMSDCDSISNNHHWR